MAGANPITAAPTVATIQRQTAASVVATPPAPQPVRDDTTLPIISGVGQTAEDAKLRATVRVDGPFVTHQTTMMLARTASHGMNEPVQLGSMVLVKPSQLQVSRTAERTGQEITGTSVPASTRPANVSRGDTPLVLSSAPASAASLIARQEMVSTPGATTTPAVEQPAASQAPLLNTAASSSAGRVADVDGLVEKTLHRLMRQLAVESERRGWAR